MGHQVYTSFWSSVPTSTDTVTDSGAQVGVRFKFLAGGRIVGLRYAREKRTGGFILGQVFDDTSLNLLSVALFKKHTPSGTGFDRWEHAYLHPQLRVATNDQCQLVIWFQTLREIYQAGALTAAAVTHGNFQALRDNVPSGRRNGSFGIVPGVSPASSSGGNQPSIDVLFLAD